MSLIVTRPQHDPTTRYISSWAGEIISFAREKGVNVVDLVKSKATRRELEGRIKKIAPRLIFLNGHGSQDAVAGHDNEILIKVGENDTLLLGKIVYALACDSGGVLGPAIAKDQSTVFIGYKDEFIFMADSRYMNRPIYDPKAKPFMESSNQVVISLLKGRSAREAFERSKELFKKHFVALSSSNADADSLQIAQFLWWDMQHQVCLGNQSTTL
jgi:hypothetical protein